VRFCRAPAIVIISAAVIGGCSSRPVVDAPATAVLVGDSILAGAETEVTSALQRHGWTVHVEAVGGSAIMGVWPTLSWPQRIEALVREQRPKVVVVQLGTNGCGCPRAADGIEEVMERLRSVPRVYWVNVREDAPTPANPAAMNDALDDAQDQWSNLNVINLDKRFRSHTDWVRDDRVHPTQRGNNALAELIADALPTVRHRTAMHAADR
jgi:lysophospholipase L1-like esterase